MYYYYYHYYYLYFYKLQATQNSFNLVFNLKQA